MKIYSDQDNFIWLFLPEHQLKVCQNKALHGINTKNTNSFSQVFFCILETIY